MDIGNSIRVGLAMRKQTSAALAKHLDIDRKMVSRYINNHSSPSMARYQQIAEFLDMDVPELSALGLGAGNE